MRILMVNKFLYPKGGSETYMFTLAKHLQAAGHEVGFFGMEDEKNNTGDAPCAVVRNMDFHRDSPLVMMLNAFKTIRSEEAYAKMVYFIRDFKPDIAHLHNFNYQLTPTVIEALQDEHIPVVMTMHDAQLVCPNHMMYDLDRDEKCYDCLEGNSSQCIKRKCIHGSTLKSMIGYAEKRYWANRHIYRYIDTFICPSNFLREKVETNPDIAGRAVVLQNFSNVKCEAAYDGDRSGVLYFGRLSKEKGVEDIISAARDLPDVRFDIAGDGPLVMTVKAAAEKYRNIRYHGFLSGKRLTDMIRKAEFTLYPSRWDENCPMSVIESICLGTPVIAAGNGGLPELVEDSRTGIIISEDSTLSDTIKAALAMEDGKYENMVRNCTEHKFITPEMHVASIMHLYEEVAGRKRENNDNSLS